MITAEQKARFLELSLLAAEKKKASIISHEDSLKPEPEIEPKISPETAEKRRITILRDIQAACKRAKGQVRALEPRRVTEDD